MHKQNIYPVSSLADFLDQFESWWFRHVVWLITTTTVFGLAFYLLDVLFGAISPEHMPFGLMKCLAVGLIPAVIILFAPAVKKTQHSKPTSVYAALLQQLRELFECSVCYCCWFTMLVSPVIIVRRQATWFWKVLLFVAVSVLLLLIHSQIRHANWKETRELVKSAGLATLIMAGFTSVGFLIQSVAGW